MEPNAQTNSARTTDLPPAAPPSPPPPTRVLLVEDNPGDARLIREFIRETDAESFDVERAERLDAALARLAQEGVDLVLLDLSLPDSHGIETFRKLHAAAEGFAAGRPFGDDVCRVGVDFAPASGVPSGGLAG